MLGLHSAFEEMYPAPMQLAQACDRCKAHLSRIHTPLVVRYPYYSKQCCTFCSIKHQMHTFCFAGMTGCANTHPAGGELPSLSSAANATGKCARFALQLQTTAGMTGCEPGPRPGNPSSLYLAVLQTTLANAHFLLRKLQA
jgi:hypothetical protein